MTPPDEKDPQDPPETADELAARRATQAEREQSADFDAADPPADAGGKSMEGMEANGETETQDDGQMAMVVGVEGGKEVTLGTLIPRNVPVEFKFQMKGKSVPGTGGLIGFKTPDVMLVVPARAGAAVPDPTYGVNEAGETVVKKVTIVQELRPTAVLNANTEQARVALFGQANPIEQLVALARKEGKSDADIREIVENELSLALTA